MKKFILISIFAILTFYGYSQHVMSNLNGQNITACSGTFTLGSYSAGQNFTMTVCSDDPLNRHVRLNITGGYSFPAGTSLCVYDGTSTAAPLLVCWDNTTTAGMIAINASNTNESGCLTFVFTGGAGGASWSGTFLCEFVCQPRQVNIVSANPPIQSDDYINVCWDEDNNQSMPVQFTAAGTYPSTGYPCDDSNNTFHWNFQDGSPIQSGVGLTTVDHIFPNRQGYTVIVTIEDSQGCQNNNAVTQRIRISQAPQWNTSTTTLSPAAICMGEPVNMCGYYSSTDWANSVVPTIADTTSLPDGDGVCYETSLMQNQFEPGQTLQNHMLIHGICMSLEHSYLGDITIAIQCPNGQQVQMQAQGGGGTHLGEPIDNSWDNNEVPGVGYWYCITPTATQTMTQASSSVGTLPAGNYASSQSLNGLVGCPLNGTWTITICDNWSSDDGYIFGWYIDFDQSLFPEMWGYSTTYTPTSWTGLYGYEVDAPSNQNCATGTYTTTGTPDVNSPQPFIFTITDNFGCEHDTAIYVTVRNQFDPNCCIIPNPSAGSNAAVCALSYNLNATLAAGNNGYWTQVSGPGTASFANPTSPTSTVTVNPYGQYVFQWNEEYNGNPGCASSATVTITFNETFDPTLTPVADRCVNSSPFQVQAVNMGTLACNPNPQLLNTTSGIFTPSLPGSYTITNTVNDPCSGGPLVSTITFTVFDELSVNNLTETCGPLASPTLFTVAFTVVGSQGNPYTGTYIVNGIDQSNSNYSTQFESPGSYNIVVTDPNGCTDVDINGYRDCGCDFFAGTMGSLQTVILCADECTEPDVTHNGNEVTYNSETGDNAAFEFMIHTGNNIPLAYSPTPNFCLSTFGGSFNTIYYVSAICGLPMGNGHANLTPPSCFSISPGTPVMWQQNPVAHAGTNRDTCGLVITLNANADNLEPGMYGYWSSPCEFFAIGGTNHTQPNPLVLATDYNDCVFTWNVVNGECTATDDVIIRFLRTPSPYAGENQVVCGTSTVMEAVPSMSGTSLSWSGNGTAFTPPTSAEATTQISLHGTYQYTFIENNGGCIGTDQVLVTYIPEPSPTVTAGTDTVCGVIHNIQVYNSTGVGQWAAYQPGTTTLLNPQPIFSPNISSPAVQVTVPNYAGLSSTIDFVWTEVQQLSGVECPGSVTKRVVFGREPIASVGPVNEAEVCGNCIELEADTTGSGWAIGNWIVGKVQYESWDPASNEPATTLCINPLGSYGDTAYVRAPIAWAMKNPEATGCMSIDTMFVTFYQQPDANAGLDKAVCGNNTILGAVYNFPENDGYSPSGIWSVYQRPIPSASANINPLNSDTTNVSVSHVGIWEFVFRENNSNLPSCHSTDTVLIEFVENPVITAGENKDVCGPCTQLEGISGGYEGSWLPNGADFDDFSDPTTNVCVNNYTARTFTWLESNTATLPQFTLSCSATDDVVITFWRVPTANILTDEADSTVCGLTFPRLRAENPGTGISGYWYNTNPATSYSPNPFTVQASATVPSYGYHDFYWIEETGPEMTPGFCTDTAGPLRIHFIEVPNANAGGDTLFCGYTGSLSALPSIGTGVWSTPSVTNITFEDLNNPNTQVTSSVLNADNPTNPCFSLIWTEDNTNGCTDKDTICVTFARIPTANMQIIPPKCFGEPATIKAVEDTLGQYTWNFYAGVIDSMSPPNLQGGIFRNFVFWNDEAESHIVSLITTNSWGCQSPIRVDTVYEPPIPDFDVTLVGDTCLIGKGGIIFGDTLQNNSFFWLNEDVGPPYGSPITAVYNIPQGEYYIRTSYLTANDIHYAYYLSTFGTANCVDTLLYEIEPIGMIDASFEISADIILEDLTAPEAPVIFLNYSDYDDVRKRCEWHFGDGNVLKNCDDLVEHTYTEAGCFTPFLIVMNRDLPECRDTAFLDACIRIDNQSSLEIPNIFSPNADGVNDYFQVKATTLRTFSGTIVNRWGRTVYTWENWKDLDAGWDGNLDGGTKAAPGVYYFIIKAEGLDGQPYDEHGALHLMRD